jgi:hypothetical protein
MIAMNNNITVILKRKTNHDKGMQMRTFKSSILIICLLYACGDEVSLTNSDMGDDKGLSSVNLQRLDQDVSTQNTNTTNANQSNQNGVDMQFNPDQNLMVQPPNDPNNPAPNDPNNPAPNDPNNPAPNDPNNPAPNDPPNDPNNPPNDPNPVIDQPCAQCNANQYCCADQCIDLAVEDLSALGLNADTLPLAAVDPNACNRLRYGLYANERENRKISQLPDFSYAGYMKGGVAIPNDIPTVVTISPINGDNRAQIQAAIDQVSALPINANGYRGAVLLNRGTYEVGNSLRISASGVVIRGEGQGSGRTILRATRRAQHELIILGGQDTKVREVPNTRFNITSAVVPVGSRVIEVDAQHQFNVGDLVIVKHTPNQAWIDRINMARFNWTPEGFDIAHERTITAINQNQITVDIPMVNIIDQEYGGGYIAKADSSLRLDKIGVEDLRLVSDYQGSTDENHAWTGVAMKHVQNSWVRRVTVENFGYSAVWIGDESAFNTVEEVAMLDPISIIDGGRRYSFKVDGGIGNLFQRCFAREGRHNFVTGGRTTGPNVWLDCLSINNHSDEGPHLKWSTGILFDNIKSADLDVQNRGASGENDGHGWAGAQVMFWNTKADAMICDSPKGAINWSVGAVGRFHDGFVRENPCMRIASGPNANRVGLRSLYLKQLEDRLGAGAVEAVTIEAQRTGRIWTVLGQWAGQGRLANFLN